MERSASTKLTRKSRRYDESPQASFQVSIAGANRILKAKIPVGNGKTVELQGKSWAGDATAFIVPSLDLALDAGYPVGKVMNAVFITHTHGEHVHHLTHLKSKTKVPTFYLPSQAVPNTQRFLDVAQQLSSQMTTEEYNNFDWEPSFKLHGVQPGDRISVHPKRGLVCHVVKCDHGDSTPCTGYVFATVKNSLKAKYRGLPGLEIAKLRKEGGVVTEEKEQPMFAYLLDTTASILQGKDAGRIFSCPSIIIECTFLTDDYRANAERTKHVLWSDLKPHVQAHPEIVFVLVHFSRRWSSREVAEFFQKENLPNVIPWVPSSDTALYCRPVGSSETEIDEIYVHS